eukprot:TRINITY_DN62232_c0_g1_i1.p1 TRINITY_DN62232_c0_g1~~TRINITY_DN62232_c0_g1_i1.p1  ORF type:complete len:187 (+),score=16.62 TRINITY_DN62232_c0_g1_i1:89-649(+)
MGEALRLDQGNQIAQDGLRLVEVDLAKRRETDSALASALDNKDAYYIQQHKERGNTAFAEKQYKKAIHYFSRGIELDPTNEVFYSNRSAAHCFEGNFEQAVADAKKAIELKPNWQKGHGRLGNAYQGMKKYDEAIAAFSKALELDPNNTVLTKSLQAVKEEKAAAPPPEKVVEGEDRFMKPRGMMM